MSFADSVTGATAAGTHHGGKKRLTLVIGTGPETKVEGQKFGNRPCLSIWVQLEENEWGEKNGRERERERKVELKER